MDKRLKNNIKNKIGEIKTMSCGELAEIVEYRGVNDITVKFIKTGELVRCRYGHFKNGKVKSNFTPSVYNVGIVGLEEIRDKSGKIIKSYQIWHAMLKRCYNIEFQDKNPTYKNCTVCNEWLFYPNFKKWYEENYYEIDNERIELDKDILNKGNKIYSPDTCVFVPKNVNSLFVKKDANRGDLPIGVYQYKTSGKYSACCGIFDSKSGISKRKYLGLCNTIEEAFLCYKKAKEESIKRIADHYKDKIPKRLYEAMYKYEVHIDD